MKKYLFLFILLPFLSSFSSCGKEEVYPSGKNTFTGQVNGEPFKAQSDDFKKGPISAAVRDTVFALSGTYTIDDWESIGFRIENFSGIGNYILGGKSPNYGRYYYSFTTYDDRAYTNSQYTGEVKVSHYLPERGIIAGTFHFTAYDSLSEATHQITDGKFDVQFSTPE